MTRLFSQSGAAQQLVPLGLEVRSVSRMSVSAANTGGQKCRHP